MATNRIAGITIEIGGDTSKLTSALRDVDKSLSATQRNLKDIDKLLKLDPGNTELLTQKQKNLEKAIEGTKDRLEQLKAAQKDALSPEQHDALQREIIETEQKLQGLEDEYKNFGSVAQQQLKLVGEKIKDIGSKVTEAGHQLTQKLTVPIMAVGAAAAKSWADVDEGLDTVTVKTGATGEALEELQELVKEIPQEINVSFAEAGEAIGEVNTRFGLTGESAKDLSEQFLKFAKLNKTDVSSSIDMTQKAMAAFGLSTDDASALLDTFNAVGQRTGVDINTLMTAVTNNAAAFDEMGFSASDAANFIGDVEVSGLDTSAMLAGLKKAMTNATKEGKPMSQALAEIEYSMKNADTETDAMNYAMELFGTKAGPAIAKACRSGQISFNSLGTSIKDNMGNVSETFENTQDPIDKFATTMNTLKVVGAELMDTVGQLLIPILQKLAEKAKDLLNWWNSLTDGQKELIVKVVALVAALGPLLSILGPIISGIGGILTVLNPTTAAIIAVIAAVAAVTTAVVKNWDKIKTATKKAFDAIGKTIKDTMTAVKNTVTTVGNAIGTAASKAWNTVKTGAQNAWNNIGTNISTAWNGIKNTVTTAANNVQQNLSRTWDSMKTGAANVWGGIKTSVSGGIESVRSTMSSGLQNVQNIAKNAWDGVKNVTSSVWNSQIVTTIRSAAGSLQSAAQSGFNSVKSAAVSVFNSLPSAIKGAFNGVINFVSSMVQKLKNMFHFNWSLPKIKLPHFSMTGKFSLNPPSIPRISVQWYKKAYENAIMFDQPTVIPTATGLKGFGDGVGGEVVLGLNKLRQLVGTSGGGVTINVYASAGMNINQLAEKIEDRFVSLQKQREAAYA